MIITRLRRLATGSVLVIGFAAGAFAATNTANDPNDRFDLKKLPSGTYAVDKNHANAVWMVNHLGFSNYPGRFDSIDGSLKFNTKDPTKSVLDIKIDTASIDTASAKLKEHLLGKDWFDTATYPTITFKSTKIEKLTDRTGKVTGDLTLHGVTKPVTLDVTFNGGAVNPISSAPTLGFSARGELKRSDFGMTSYVPMIGDTVSLMIESEFSQPPKDKKPRP